VRLNYIKKLSAIAGAGLQKNVGHMKLYRSFGDPEFARNGPSRELADGQMCDLHT